MLPDLKFLKANGIVGDTRDSGSHQSTIQLDRIWRQFGLLLQSRLLCTAFEGGFLESFRTVLLADGLCKQIDNNELGQMFAEWTEVTDRYVKLVKTANKLMGDIQLRTKFPNQELENRVYHLSYHVSERSFFSTAAEQKFLRKAPSSTSCVDISTPRVVENSSTLRPKSITDFDESLEQ